MNTRYSIRREPQGLTLPFGAGGVAAVGALALGIVGLMVPIAWLETISFQLYLDSISTLAEPPLGTTARIIAALALALFGALLGYVLAKAFGVAASDFSFADLMARLRGTGLDDEDDAPDLRAADRHPDAPARRPFSAARDIPARDWDDGEWHADADFGADRGVDYDELILDAQFESVSDGQDEATADAASVPLVDQPSSYVGHERAAWTPAHESIEDYDLQPPDPADWEVAAAAGPGPTRQGDGPASQVDRNVPVDPFEDPAAQSAEMIERLAPAAQAPLDLSVARLDELLARLESGLTRKSPPIAGLPLVKPLVGRGDQDGARDDENAAPPAYPDPAFPQDPALAAALATLRKMNARAG